MLHFISESMWKSGESSFDLISANSNKTILVKTLIRTEDSISYTYYYYIRSYLGEPRRFVIKYNLYSKRPKFTYVLYMDKIKE